MATPSLAMIPSAIADSKVYSVLPNNGDGDFTFNRDSSATRVGSNGLIQEVGFFGSDVLNGYNFTIGYTVYPSGSIDSATSFTSLSGGGGVRPNSDVLSSGKTYTCSLAGTVSTGNVQLIQWDGAGAYSPNFSGTFDTTFEFTQTGSYNKFWLRNDSAATTTITKFTIKEVTGDQPRLNYDINANGQVQSCPSLLLEPASTNLITYSEDFSNAAWIKLNSTITSNSIVSPNGTLNADKIVESATIGGHSISFNHTSSANMSFSVFVKLGERTFVQLQALGVGSTDCIFNLSDGTIVSTESGATANIKDYGNGWYRCSISYTSTGTNNPAIKIYNNSDSYQGDGTSGIYIFGAMLEESSYSTSYIPTLSGASQTRTIEICEKTGLTNYIGQTEGTMYWEGKFQDAQNPILMQIVPSSANYQSSIYIEFNKASNTIRLNIYDSGVLQTAFSTAATPETKYKIALAYKQNDIQGYVNGVSIGSSTIATIQSGLDKLLIGSLVAYPTNNAFVGSKTTGVRLYQTRLTNAQLQTLTTL